MFDWESDGPISVWRRVVLHLPGQVSWLADQHLTDTFPSMLVDSGFRRSAPRLQWRNRGGFSPPSLLNRNGAPGVLFDC